MVFPHKHAAEDQQTITQVAEIDLEFDGDQRPAAKTESADEFWDRLMRENHVEGEADVGVDDIIRENY